MGTPQLRTALAASIGALLLAACSSAGGQVANHSASPVRTGASPASSSPSSASPPATAHAADAYGVLTDWQPGASTYNVYLVTPDGGIAAHAQASTPAIVTCGPDNSTPYLPPPVSASHSLAYFMDARGDVRSLSPDGSTSDALFHVAVGANKWSFFAVNPDGVHLAATTVTYNGQGLATTQLYVDQIVPNGVEQVGTPPSLRFQETGSTTLWPVGWHAGLLVLAVVPACPGAIGPTYWASELHVVDPGTAVRKVTIGGAGCVLAGPPSPAGAVCITGSGDAQVVGWDGRPRNAGPAGTPHPIYISPNGQLLASVADTTTNVVSGGTIIGAQNTTVSLPSLSMCGWVDDSHVLGAGGTGPAKVGNVADRTVTTLNVSGFCAGRIPGDL
ncbi:MAG TPA: hypothetical protein VFL29_04915 [Candidatus Dormibacteraeota bacterium]|nr:hypothetical protein [Candidatus Dormibacteraeota bacterium]